MGRLQTEGKWSCLTRRSPPTPRCLPPALSSSPAPTLETWGEVTAVNVTHAHRYGTATAQAWHRLHPRLTVGPRGPVHTAFRVTSPML